MKLLKEKIYKAIPKFDGESEDFKEWVRRDNGPGICYISLSPWNMNQPPILCW